MSSLPNQSKPLIPAAGQSAIPAAESYFNLLQLTDAEFKALRELIHSRFGINLTEQKRSLLAGRLQKVVRARKFESFDQYYHFVLADRSGQALVELIDRISTNHTAFFREPAHFDFLRQVALPETLERHRRQGNRDLRIWCAGCATGEEAYSLQMTIAESLGHEYGSWDAGLLATDISAAALSAARAGVYAEDRVQTVLPNLLQKYFTRGDDERWHAKFQLRKEITFRRFNLMNERFPFRRPFDLIFCRNVMIYFDQETKRRLAARFATATVSGGYLFVGHSESLERSECPYAYVMPAVYRRDSAG